MLLYPAAIRIKAASKAIVVIMVANDVSKGITKLSGFKPLLKVIIDMLNDKSAMEITAIMFDSQMAIKKLSTLVGANTRFTAKEMMAKTVNIIREAAQALLTFFR
jgi:hypothetical protein